MNTNKKHRASISVMVLIMSVIIITIGLGYVFLNKTNNELANKNKNWLLDYYTIESVINQDIANLENYLRVNLKTIPSENKLQEFEEELSTKIVSEIDISAKNDKIVVSLFTNNEKINLNSDIGISTILDYNVNTGSLFIEKFKEIPPEIEYHSFY